MKLRWSVQSDQPFCYARNLPSFSTGLPWHCQPSTPRTPMERCGCKAHIPQQRNKASTENAEILPRHCTLNLKLAQGISHQRSHYSNHLHELIAYSVPANHVLSLEQPCKVYKILHLHLWNLKFSEVNWPVQNHTLLRGGQGFK